jgi:hypothetical protein
VSKTFKTVLLSCLATVAVAADKDGQLKGWRVFGISTSAQLVAKSIDPNAMLTQTRVLIKRQAAP